MKVEVRADDTAHITGYVNVVERKSRPVMTPHGKCIEIVEQRAFEQALERAGNVSVTVDHNNSHFYASTSNNTLKLYEDNIGLHADVIISDPDVVELAKKGKIKGWSFGMYNVVDELEQRADDIPIRHIKSLDLDHITLVVNKCPVYSATSVELRADTETEIEERASTEKVEVSIEQKEVVKVDYTDFENRINSLKVAK